MLVDEAVEIKLCGRPCTGSHAHPLEPGEILQKLHDALPEGDGIVGRNEAARDFIHDDVGKSAGARGDDGPSHLGRLEGDQPERLPPARRHQHDRRLVEPAGDLVRGRPPGELDPAGESERRGERLETRPFGAVAADDQPWRGGVRGDPRERLQGGIEPLFSRQPPEGEQDRGIPGKRCGREGRGRQRIVDAPQLRGEFGGPGVNRLETGTGKGDERRPAILQRAANRGTAGDLFDQQMQRGDEPRRHGGTGHLLDAEDRAVEVDVFDVGLEAGANLLDGAARLQHRLQVLPSEGILQGKPVDRRAPVDLDAWLRWMQQVGDDRALMPPVHERSRQRTCEHLDAADEREISFRPEENSHAASGEREAMGIRRGDRSSSGSGRS